MDPDKKQRTFGWDIEAHRLRDQTIAGTRLPNSITVSDGSVSKSTLLLLLYRLNHHAWGDAYCFPGQDRLAREMGLDRKTVGRAVEAAERKQLLKVEKKKTRESRVVCNHYTICWEMLAELGFDREHPEMLLEQSDTVTQRSEERRDTPGGALGHSDPSDVTLVPKRCDILTHNQDGFVGDGNSKRPSPPAAQGDVGDGLLKFRWGRRIDPSELRDPERIDDLFDIAVVQGAAQPTKRDRIAFFALVIYVNRQEPREGREVNHVGLLTDLLAGRHPDAGNGSRDWRVRPENRDEDTARRVIDKLDRQAEPVEEPPKVETPEESLARQRRELQEASR